MPQKTKTQRHTLSSSRGFSIIEVLFAVLLFTVMIVGLSQLLVSGVGQRAVDVDQQLALIAVTTIADRTLSEIRDNTGTGSPGGGSQGACDAVKTFEATIDEAAVAKLPYATVSPFLFTSCPSCQVEVMLTCTPATNFWNGYVRVRDIDRSRTVADIPIACYQP